MVLPIEEQIHRYYIALEAEKAKAQHRKPRPVPVPWVRPHKDGLCVEPDFLRAVQEFDYDLEDESFQAFCQSRARLSFAGIKGGRCWQFFSDFQRGKDQYLAEPEFQFAQEWQGKHRRYSAAELEVGWKIIRLGRARLQDCWEIYLGRSAAERPLRPAKKQPKKPPRSAAERPKRPSRPQGAR
jgi:hypothetical protein